MRQGQTYCWRIIIEIFIIIIIIIIIFIITLGGAITWRSEYCDRACVYVCYFDE